ncbi:hypothetical protein [Variovorax sp. Varisp62]|uniref:hypothetical protein n=1 Tax=Variovorax sp. Varisp62 TaxID=3243049 RepID=UPI0039B4DF21
MSAIVKFFLKNPEKKKMGEIVVISRENMLLLGNFLPTTEFQPCEELFREFECAVNDQLFKEVERLEEAIQGLNFYLTDSPLDENIFEIEDLQIMKDGVSFRLRSS